MLELSTLKPDVKTLPQIWWDNRYIGGYTDFAAEIENTMGNYGNGKI
jgi:glutaredoxin